MSTGATVPGHPVHANYAQRTIRVADRIVELLSGSAHRVCIRAQYSRAALQSIRSSQPIPGHEERMNTTRISLLQRIKEPGNDAAWSEFDSIYRPMLTLYARDRGLSREDTEDMVQYCMTAIHKHISGFNYDPKKGRFKSWLRTMVNNRWRNDIRKRKEQAADAAVLDESPARDEAPDETFDRAWAQQHLRHALKLLRDEHDPTTYLAYQKYGVQNRPGPEVCAELGMTQNQLYKIKWRLTRRLAQILKSLEGDDEA